MKKHVFYVRAHSVKPFSLVVATLEHRVIQILLVRRVNAHLSLLSFALFDYCIDCFVEIIILNLPSLSPLEQILVDVLHSYFIKLRATLLVSSTFI